MSRQFTIVMSRIEMQWLHRQLTNVKEKYEAKGEVAAVNELTPLIITCADLLDKGITEKDRLMSLRQELEDAILYCEEPEAVVEARRRLDELPKEETYKVTFDRQTAKFALRQVEFEIKWLREVNIPNLEKRTEYPDKIMTKSYYINKAKKAKTILEEFKKRLEKELSI
jgi:hypothetical protein